MGELTDVHGAHRPHALCHRGRAPGSGAGGMAWIGEVLMDPVIALAALIILAVEVWIRLL